MTPAKAHLADLPIANIFRQFVGYRGCQPVIYAGAWDDQSDAVIRADCTQSQTGLSPKAHRCCLAGMTALRIIQGLPGYEDVRDLFSGGLFLQCPDIWRLCLEFYRDDTYVLKRRILLELVQDVEDFSKDRVAVIMEAPRQTTFPDSWQIMGLTFENILGRGMEGLLWRAYDYEMSGFEAYCSSVPLERRRSTEPGASSNGSPSHR